MADLEKDYARYNFRSGTPVPPSQPTPSYLPRLNFHESTLNQQPSQNPQDRNSTFHYNYLPPLPNVSTGTQGHSIALNNNFTSRQPENTSRLDNVINPSYALRPSDINQRHDNAANQSYGHRPNPSTNNIGYHSNQPTSTYVSRHDPAEGPSNYNSLSNSNNTSNPISASNFPPAPHKNSCDCPHHHPSTFNQHYIPRRTNSTDSTYQANGILSNNEDTSEEAALRKVKNAQNLILTPELFEKLYLSPQSAVQGDLRKTFANPTPIALIGYILALTPLSCDYMGLRGAGVGMGWAGIGTFWFFGGGLMLLGGILEFILGNTFSSVVFASYGAYWFSYAALGTPAFNTAGSYEGVTSAPASTAITPGFESTWAFFLLFMGILSFIYLICSLRTNIMFVIVFLSLMCGFLVEAGSYWNNAAGNSDLGASLLVAAGVIYFVGTLAGWEVLVSQLLASVDFPYQLPVGDISHIIKGYSERKKTLGRYPV